MSDIGRFIQEFLKDHFLQDDITVSYNSVSATLLLLYEIILNFSDEVQYIWLSPWSLVTILYLLIRYFTLVFLILNSYAATGSNLPISLGPVLIIPAVDVLILLRVYALYERSKSIGGFLIFLWLVETTIVLVLTGLGLGPRKGASPNPVPGILTGCDPTDLFNAHNLIIGGSVTIIFQAIYLGLALYKLVVQIKFVKRLTPLFEIFFRDGALYCFNVLAMYALNVFFAQHFRSTPLEGVGSVWIVSFVAITAGKLVLNLRKRAHGDSSNNVSNLSRLSESPEFQVGTPTEPIQSTVMIDVSQMHGGTEERLPTSR